MLLVEVDAHILVVQDLDALDRATLNQPLDHLPVATEGGTIRLAKKRIGHNAYGNHSPKPHEVEAWPWRGAIIYLRHFSLYKHFDY